MYQYVKRTLDESVVHFQREVMLRVIIYGVLATGTHVLLERGLKSLGLGGLNVHIVSGVALITYLTMVYVEVKDVDFYGDYGVFGYKGIFYDLRRKSSLGFDLEGMNNSIKLNVVFISGYFYLLGYAGFSVVSSLDVNSLAGIVHLLASLFVGMFPVILMYLSSYMRMSTLYVKKARIAMAEVVYLYMKQEGKILKEYPDFMDWVSTSKSKRKKMYTVEQNSYYSKLNQDIEGEVDGIGTYLDELLLINTVTDENRSEIASVIERALRNKGYDIEVDLNVKLDRSKQVMIPDEDVSKD